MKPAQVKNLIATNIFKSGLGEIELYNQSFQEKTGAAYVLVKSARDRRLICIGDSIPTRLRGESKSLTFDGKPIQAKVCPLSHENAVALRSLFPWTAPLVVGLRTSFGAGDRLGIATPGHIRAFKGYAIFPVLAQQSIREMTRTQRSAEQVMDDATWAVLQEGYTGGFGSDADHLKTLEDIRSTVEAGFVGFTVDPSDHIVNRADAMSLGELEQAYKRLFATAAEAASFLTEYADQQFPVKGTQHSIVIKVRKDELLRLAVKYLPAVRHTITCYRELEKLFGDKPFDFEMSVDETETPTTPSAHFLVISELVKAGVKLTSLAPRFIGEFQKAIDYIGDLHEFRRQLREHVAIAEHFGGYKISVHSGSDKFSIFPIVGEETGGVFHEKTAGTSYLEALRIVSRRDPKLFREIVAFARPKFEGERFSYHVTTDMSKVPDAEKLSDGELERMLDENDSRQVLHITFGSVLTTKNDAGKYLFRERIYDLLHRHEEEYYQVLQTLFIKHLKAFKVPKK